MPIPYTGERTHLFNPDGSRVEAFGWVVGVTVNRQESPGRPLPRRQPR